MSFLPDKRLLASYPLTWEGLANVPDRFCVDNLSTHAHIVAQYNPTEFEESIGTEWNRLTTPGSSHQRMHFSNTQNYTVSMELNFRALSEEDYDEVNTTRHHLMSWCYPQSATASSPGQGPPRLLATWPLVFSIECYLISCTFKNKRFAPDGRCTMFTANVKFEECRDTRLTSEDVVQTSVVRGEV
jgi:hypothetical protein